MGVSNSKPSVLFEETVLFEEISWNMSEGIQKGPCVYLGNNITQVHIICPLRALNKKDHIIKIKITDGFLSIYNLWEKIHEVYKKYKNKLDHIYFEGLKLINEENNIKTFMIRTGS